MNSEKNHIIEKVFLEVNTSCLETAHYIKNNISVFLQNELFPKLEIILQKYNPNNKVIRFNKLNVDFSIEEWSNFEGVKFEICNQLEEEIKKHQKQISKNEIKQTDLFKPENQIQYLTGIENRREIFLFFLENAYLPWFGKEKHILEFNTLELWKQSIKEEGFIQKFKDLLVKSDSAIERFIYQFTDEIIITFLIELNPKFKSYKKSLLKFLSRVNAAIRYSFLYLLFKISISVKEKKILDSLDSFINQIKENKIYITEDFGFESLPEIIKFIQINSLKIVQIDSPYLNIIQSRIEELESQRETSVVSGKEMPVTLDKETAVDSKEYTKEEKKLSVLEHKTVKISVDDNEPLQEKAELTLFDKGISVEDTKYVQKEDQFTFFEKETGEIAVNNAGLVLLHPFLKQFFIKNKIADKLGVIDKNKYSLAVQSLHFLATGNENIFEGNLIFEKFLCGIPLSLSIQKKSLLNDNIKEEALTLLKELIKNWTALKKTSPEGLRQMFLQRDGKLIHKNQKYKLIVERKVQDLLLAKLSWSISILKLPWHKSLLFVEW
jgi:hypothetical protein